jgi:hypothetical protein
MTCMGSKARRGSGSNSSSTCGLRLHNAPLLATTLPPPPAAALLPTKRALRLFVQHQDSLLAFVFSERREALPAGAHQSCDEPLLLPLVVGFRSSSSKLFLELVPSSFLGSLFCSVRVLCCCDRGCLSCMQVSDDATVSAWKLCVVCLAPVSGNVYREHFVADSLRMLLDLYPEKGGGI